MKCGQMYLTKPLQGQKFRDMWAFLQNCAKNYANSTEAKETIKLQDVASSQKCVDRLPKSPPSKPPFYTPEHLLPELDPQVPQCVRAGQTASKE